MILSVNGCMRLCYDSDVIIDPPSFSHSSLRTNCEGSNIVCTCVSCELCPSVYVWIPCLRNLQCHPSCSYSLLKSVLYFVFR